jgi:hypothetical protein
MHYVFSVCYVFTSRCLVMALNIKNSSAFVVTSLPAVACLIAPHARNSWLLTHSRVWPPLASTCWSQRQSQSHVTTDGPSVSQSWYQTKSRETRPDFCHCQTFAGYVIVGAPSLTRRQFCHLPRSQLAEGRSVKLLLGFASTVIPTVYSRSTTKIFILS